MALPDWIEIVAAVFTAITATAAAVAAWKSATAAKKSAEAAATANRLEIARETRYLYDVLNQLIIDFIGSPDSIDQHRYIELHYCVERSKAFLNADLYELLNDIINTFDCRRHSSQRVFWTKERMDETRLKLNRCRDMLKDPASISK